jgi:carbamoylphosphate synthase small subunit
MGHQLLSMAAGCETYKMTYGALSISLPVCMPDRLSGCLSVYLHCLPHNISRAGKRSQSDRHFSNIF